MIRFVEINAILENYKEEALKEYTELETKRHAHFTYENRDGSSPESIVHWVKELQEHVDSRRTQKQTQELVRQILKRSTMPLKTFYKSITDNEEKTAFMQILIKTEAFILKTDYERAKEYFDLGYHMEQDKTKHLENIIKKAIDEKIEMVSSADYQNDKSVIDNEKYRTKNKRMILEEYLGTISIMKKTEKDKVIFPIQTLLQSSDSEFLIDYDDISNDPDDRAIVCAIIDMAHNLGLQTIAEGVETAEQLAFLRLHGCNEVQGYYFSKPLPSVEFEQFLHTNGNMKNLTK